MSNLEFVEVYKQKLKDLADECKEQVRNGELTEEDAAFRFDMVKDEMLWGMDDFD